MKEIDAEILEVVLRTQEEIVSRYCVYMEKTENLVSLLRSGDFAELEPLWEERQKAMEEINYIFTVFRPVEEWFEHKFTCSEVTFKMIKDYFNDERVSNNFVRMQEILTRAQALEQEAGELIGKNLDNLKKSISDLQKNGRGFRGYTRCKIDSRKKNRKAHFVDKKG